MTCETCGEKPKKCGNCNKDFPRSVIEINNPETLVLLRKVVIPASMGTEEQVPAAVGKYHNVILKYEANNHVYLYSSDGIPTLLEMDVPQEIIDRIDTLEDNVDDLNDAMEGKLDTSTTFWGQTVNNGEVKGSLIFEGDPATTGTDIFLEADGSLTIHAGSANWVTFKKTDDILDNEVNFSMATLRDIANGSSDTDAVNVRQMNSALSTKQDPLTAGFGIDITNNTIKATNSGIAKVLTTDDYNWNSTSHSSVEPYDSVALWLLAPGLYIFGNGVSGYVGERGSDHLWIPTNDKKLYQVTPSGTYGVLIMAWEEYISTGGSPMEFAKMYGVVRTSGGITRLGYLGAPIDDLSSNNTEIPLSARQGKMLSDKIGDLSTLTTYRKDSIVNAINEINKEGDYSDTIELDTETKWVNGDKIYKMTIQVASLPNSGSSTYSFGVPSTTLGQVVKFEIIAHNQNTSTFIQVPDGIGISAKVETGGVRVDTTADYSGYSAYITVWYTKNS